MLNGRWGKMALVAALALALGACDETTDPAPAGDEGAPITDAATFPTADVTDDAPTVDDAGLDATTGPETTPDVAPPTPDVAPDAPSPEDVTPTGCTSDDGCEDAALPWCDLATGACVGCLEASHCDDGDPCTDDSCNPVGWTCESTASESCCEDDGDCDDGDPCTDNICVGGQCEVAIAPGCCVTPDDCAPLACHTAACVANACSYKPLAGCCVEDKDCDDGVDCSVDTCDLVTGTCQSELAEGCCTEDTDCDDGDACTTDTCGAGGCAFEANEDCCLTDADCEDDDPCTSSKCLGGSCLTAINPACCTEDSDCGEDTTCTTYTCDGGKCMSVTEPDCCETDADCAGVDPCVDAQCVDGACEGESDPGCLTLPADADVWLEGSGSKSSYDFLIVGKTGSYMKKRTLVRVDLSDLPADAEVLAAKLEVYYYGTTSPSGTTETKIARTVQAHRMLVPWVETEATSAVASTGHAWAETYVGLGTDAEITPLSSQLWDPEEGAGWKGFDITDALLQWQSGAAPNYGVLLWATNEDTNGHDMRMHAREASDPSLRPRVRVVTSPTATD